MNIVGRILSAFRKTPAEPGGTYSGSAGCLCNDCQAKAGITNGLITVIKNLQGNATSRTMPAPPGWQPPEPGKENRICLVCNAGDITPDDIIEIPGKFMRHVNGDTTRIHGKTFAVCGPCRRTVKGKVFIEINRRSSQEELGPEQTSRLIEELERKYEAEARGQQYD